jgi:itaconate CoA-transferase
VYVSFAVATRQDWEVFCREVLARPDLLEDARFETSELRRKNRVVLERTVEEIFLQRNHDEWLVRLEKSRLPYGEVRGIAQVAAHPQVLARGMVREVDSPVGRIPVTSSPLRLSDSPARFDPIPSLGENTESVLGELGYSSEEIQNLRNEKVIQS